jgi:hypothetical protein
MSQSDIELAYESCAEWCAKRGLMGAKGEPLPDSLPSEVVEMINTNRRAFKRKVWDRAYVLKMRELGAEPYPFSIIIRQI